MYTDLEELDERIRVEREILETMATPLVERGESLGENEEVLRRSRLLDELILQEQALRNKG